VFRHSTFNGAEKSDVFNIYNLINLDCWGRSLELIRDLLREAQTEFYDASGSGTSVFRPTSGPGGQFHWKHPTRGLDTVIMEGTKKQVLVDDIN
jgi:hypothetical protein